MRRDCFLEPRKFRIIDQVDCALLTYVDIISFTFSPSIELSNLTRPIKQPHNITRDNTNKITPAPTSPISAPEKLNNGSLQNYWEKF